MTTRRFRKWERRHMPGAGRGWTGALFVMVASVLVWAGLFLLPFSAMAVEVERVTVGISVPVPHLLPLKHAEAKGVFRGEGVTLQLLQMNSALATKALVSGDLDYSTMIGTVVARAAHGVPVKVVFVSAAKPDFFLVARPEITSVQAIKGGVIGIGSHGALDDNLIRLVLKRGGVDPERDVTVLSLGLGSVRLSALVAGSIRATMLASPANLPLERRGYRRLAYAGDYMQGVMSGLSASDAKIKARAEQVKKLLRGFLRGVEYFRTHQAESVEGLMGWLKVDRAAAEFAYQLSIKGMPENGIASDEAFKTVIEMAAQREKTSGEVPVSRVADYGLLREVLREMRP